MDVDNERYLNTVRKIMLKLPQVEECLHLETPAFKVQKEFLARIQDDGKTLAISCKKKDNWLKLDPNIFFVTHPYRNADILFINLSEISKNDLTQIITDGWKEIAPKELLADYLSKERNYYLGYRGIPIYGMLFCGVIIAAIGIYMSYYHISAIGLTKLSSKSNRVGVISSAYAIIIGICLSIFPIYILIKSKLKRN